MLDDWRTTIMYFDCSCRKSWKSLAGNQGMVVGEEVGKHDGFTLKIASRLFWRWRHIGVFLLFVWLWMGLVWSYSPVLYNADHSWRFQTTWGMVQKLLVVQIIEIIKKTDTSSALLLIFIIFDAEFNGLWLWTCPGSGTLVLSLSFCLGCFYLCYF